MVEWAVRITPGLKPASLQRALKNLTARHDSLRLRFAQISGSWRAIVSDDYPIGLIVHDCGDLDPDRQMNFVREITINPISALDPVLFEMHLFRIGKHGDVLLFRGQHAIIDAHGMILLAEELLKYLMHLPITSKAVTHAEYVAHRGSVLAESEDRNEPFWREFLLPIEPDLEIGRVKAGLPHNTSSTIGKTNRINFAFSKDQVRNLISVAREQGCTWNTMVSATFAETLMKIAGGDAVMIDMVIGKRDSYLSSFVGCEITNVPVKTHFCGGDLRKQAVELKAKTAQVLAHTPTALFFPGNPMARLLQEAGTTSRRFFAHMLMAEARMKSSPFAKIFQSATFGKVTMAGISIERFDLFTEVDGGHELELRISSVDEKFRADLIADAEAYDHSDMEFIIAEMQGLTDSI